MLRMRDTIVWGYLMSSPKEGGTVEVPEWYVRGLDPPGRKRGNSSETPGSSCSSSPRPMPSAWHLLQGPHHLLQHLPDTCDFLDMLAGLQEEPDVMPDGRPNLPERKAAAGLFRWGPPLCSAAPATCGLVEGLLHSTVVEGLLHSTVHWQLCAVRWQGSGSIKGSLRSVRQAP
jgi:hypothetical protein